MTPLHAAAQTGNVKVVGKLLAGGADPNARTSKIAAGGGGFAAEFFRQPPGEVTPLHLAARNNHEDVMRLLVAAGADPKLKGQDGTTLLMSAAASGHIGVVRYAYELDPDINAANERGSTAVHAAVTAFQSVKEEEIVEVVRFLGTHGANLDVKDARGRTPMKIAGILPLDSVIAALAEMTGTSGKH